MRSNSRTILTGTPNSVASRFLAPLTSAVASVLSASGDQRYFPRFSLLHHLVCCIVFQIKNLPSMRSVIRALTIHDEQNRSSFAPPPKRATFSDANRSRRRLKIIRQVFVELVSRHTAVLPRKLAGFKNVCALDSTLLHAVASAWWASYRKKVNACKAHILFDLAANVPRQLVLTNGRVHDRVPFSQFLAKGWTYVVDRAYNDYRLFEHMNLSGIFFVTRMKIDASYTVTQKLKVSRTAKRKGVLSFCEVLLGQGPTKMSTPLRLVSFLDSTGKRYEFLTNRTDLSPATIADLYHARWAIEIFFKWLKRTLRMQRQLARSEAAAEMHALITLIVDILLKLLVKAATALARHVPLRTLERVRDLFFHQLTHAVHRALINSVSGTQ